MQGHNKSSQNLRDKGTKSHIKSLSGQQATHQIPSSASLLFL